MKARDARPRAREDERDRESGIEVRPPKDSHAVRAVAPISEKSRARASLGGRFARNGEMSSQLLQIETAMDDLAARVGQNDVVRYVHRFTESARAVEYALSLALRTSLSLVSRHGMKPPDALYGCVDVVHAYFFDLAEHIGELMELQDGPRGSASNWGIPGRFLPEYSASYVSCKIEPAIESLLMACESLITHSALGGREGAGRPLVGAVDLLCEAIITLNERLRERGGRG